MKTLIINKAFLLFMTFATTSFASSVSAHTGGATLGIGGTNPSATGLGQIDCFDDGNGPAHSLVISIKDLSPPEDNLLISAQIYKGIKAINITDLISGDADHSNEVELAAGQGSYWVMVNKTGAGPRRFELIWHCLTEDGTHTGTGIIVRQFDTD